VNFHLMVTYDLYRRLVMLTASTVSVMPVKSL
jgi:hypothetical protein